MTDAARRLEIANAFRVQSVGCGQLGSPLSAAILERAALDEPVQTNEVGRSPVLLPGFLRVAALAGLPLRILEIGSAAGLNLLFDRHRYELGPHRWGDAGAEITIRTAWEGAAPDLDAPLHVAARAGCDARPLDLRDPATARRLASFVWPEQRERLADLHNAMRLARREGVQVERATAARFLGRALAAKHDAVATVVFHSVVWLYLSDAERAEVTRLVREAIAGGGRRAPVYWLRMEGIAQEAELHLLRPVPEGGAEDVLLARAHYHGRHIRWLA